MSPDVALAAAFARKMSRSEGGPVIHEPVAVKDRQHVAVDEIVGVSLGAPERPACDHADALDHRRPGGAELDCHKRAG